MSDTPTLSVIVPTCGRPQALRRLLGALAWQASPPVFEVVVVADGIAADRVGVDSVEQWPFTVRVCEVPRARGAAAARNLGVSVARADLLLFLDDDVEPGPGALRSHVHTHAEHDRCIGAGALAPSATVPGLLGASLEGWWEVMNERLGDPRHRFTFRDVLTGHFSVRRDVFFEVGEFDTTLRCHEDFDFGYRAIQRGVDIQFVAGADAVHHDASGLSKILARKFDEGIASVQLADKFPPLLTALPLGRPLAQARLAGRMFRLAMHGSRALDRSVTGALRSAMWTFERASMRDKWRAMLDRSMDYWYWRGVRERAGSAEAVRAIRAQARPPEAPLLDVDLAHGLEAAEQLLDRTRPAGVRLFLHGHPVGELEPIPGAEPMRGAHLRPLLLLYLPDGFLEASARAGVLPEWLATSPEREDVDGEGSRQVPRDAA